MKGKEFFIDEFPEVWEAFSLINRGYKKTKKEGRAEGEQGDALGLILMNVESRIMLDHVVPRIEKVFPGLPIWTIHDGIMTLEAHVEVVKEIIQEECERLIGWQPHVKFE